MNDFDLEPIIEYLTPEFKKQLEEDIYKCLFKNDK